MTLKQAVSSFLCVLMAGLHMLPARAAEATPAPAVPNSCAPVLVQAATVFGFDLFPRLWQANAPANTLISPSSIHLALTMTFNGASGTTRDAMAKVLGLTGLEDQRVDIHYLTLHQNLINSDPSITIKVANGLWCKQGISFDDGFLNTNQMYFNAKVTSLDFTKPSSLAVINSWIAKRTEGKIPSIIDRIDPNSVMFLTNALYFKGPWSAPFEPTGTANHDFTLISGSKVQVPLMQRNGSYKYLSAGDVQGIRLPYGTKQRFSMYVLMPGGGTTFASFVQGLTAHSWQSYLGQFKQGVGWVRLPRFGMKYGGDLREPLTAMGMGIAFDKTKADFTGISQTPLDISKVLHKTYMKVDEQGTEAAAATSVEMRALALAPGNDFDLTFDHPYVCIIQDDETGTVLFIGAIVDPSVAI